LLENSIVPMQQYSYTTGKNATDAAMIIDAMDLLYTEKYDAFVLVSSDSDFTKLASRLRESQETVFGVGRKQTPISFVNACDEFIFIENLKDVDENPVPEKVAVKRNRTAFRKVAPAGGTAAAGSKNSSGGGSPDSMTDRQFRLIYNLLMNAHETYSDETGWAPVASAGSLFKRQNPGFDTRDFGFKKLSDLIAYLDDDFEMKGEPNRGGNSSTLYYRPIDKE
ncbi:MAG: NYN domain-containing protein, partial [Treponema sp.]|nr:NYN domain-containing protein [Treponema sp.]